MIFDPWLIFEHGVNLLQGIMFSYFVCSCLELKLLKKYKIIASSLCALLIFAALTICNKVVFYEGLAIFIYSLILFVFSVIFMHGSLPNKLFISVVPVNAMAVGSIFSTNFMSFVLNKQIVEFLPYNTYLRVITVLLSNFILFTIIYIIKRITTKKHLVLKKSEWLLLSFELIVSVVAYMFLYYSIFSTNSIKANFYIALSVAAIIIINITTYILLANYSNRHQIEIENTLLKQQAINQKSAIIETKKRYDELQKIKHDFNNVVRVIQNLNTQNKPEDINTYINSFLKEQITAVNIIDTNNNFINAIINSKLAEANKKGIQVELCIISDLETEMYLDLCSLIGNMFDNAINACTDIENSIIKLDIRRDNKELIINMKNSIKSSVLLENPTLATSKADKKNHGFGTKIIREIANNYHGFADFYEENNMFCCNVILYI